jgi:hypothetical protein
MEHNLKKMKIVILINFFLLVSLFVISIFFKPNLNLRNQLFFREIQINKKIIILNKIIGTVPEISDLPNILTTFSNSLIKDGKKNNIKNCGVEMINGNFREFSIFDIKNNLFSVSIKSNELSEEQIQKCFEELVVKKLNAFYLSLINEEIYKQKLKKDFELKSELLKKETDTSNTKVFYENSFDTEQKIVYLKSIKFLIDQNANYQPTDNKNINISNMIYYLFVVAVLFVVEITFLLFYKKKKIKLLRLNLKNFFFR